MAKRTDNPKNLELDAGEFQAEGVADVAGAFEKAFLTTPEAKQAFRAALANSAQAGKPCVQADASAQPERRRAPRRAALA